MATGILLGRKPLPEPLFQPPISYGTNRIPERKPLDPEKLLGLGLSLTTRAKDQIAEAKGLFCRLDALARMNRTNLKDENVVKALVELREEAEVLLERGLYSLDVALETMTRLRRPRPSFAERVTEASHMRWKSCFGAMAGVYARVYFQIYSMVLQMPTCGNLSHVPPKLHFSQPAKIARTRYDHRLAAAQGARVRRVVEYWRCRIVKGIEAGELPGQVIVPAGSPSPSPSSSSSSGSSSGLSSGPPQEEENTMDVDMKDGDGNSAASTRRTDLPKATNTRKGSGTAATKSAPAGGVRRSKRAQGRSESESAASIEASERLLHTGRHNLAAYLSAPKRLKPTGIALPADAPGKRKRVVQEGDNDASGAKKLRGNCPKLRFEEGWVDP